ncbi:profilin, required for normal timing of actin polymerization in response to thermal stress [Knufia peltigerae]|uniref:Profilin n=1 Tax=Knufia peltigerae TaxID=1002370 RepID=A0AA38XX63_9EURO|nr:profilin, required for normal timing of actin polymerization in response to thermal stress [Knufia peltigerae]
MSWQGQIANLSGIAQHTSTKGIPVPLPRTHPSRFPWCNLDYMLTCPANFSSLLGTGHVDKAAIFNTEGNSVWASSPGFTVTPQEMQEVVGAYKDTSTPKKVQSTGLHIAGQKYIVIKADETSLYGKKGREGVVIVKTKQALLITHYPETIQPGTAANTVEKLGAYLVSVGY